MKKMYSLLLLAFTAAGAQIPNSDFEAASGYGFENVTGWGMPFTIAVTFNTETGESTSDEIDFGNAIGAFCTSVNDAHSGERAMLIRNAYNVTGQYTIPAKISLFNTEISESPTGWNGGIPLTADADIQLLSFWYKFAPLGNDVAEAKLELFNTNNEMMGTAEIQISEPADTYTYVSVPLTFTTVGEPAFITIEFSMAAEGSVPMFGSTLLIDDLKVNSGALQTGTFKKDTFSVWPTIANSEINIIKNSNSPQNQSFTIVDTEGKTVSQNTLDFQNGIAQKINISLLANGFYILKSDDGFTTKFIKR